MTAHLRRLCRRLTFARFYRDRVIRFNYRTRTFFVNGTQAQRLVLALAISNNQGTSADVRSEDRNAEKA